METIVLEYPGVEEPIESNQLNLPIFVADFYIIKIPIVTLKRKYNVLANFMAMVSY